MADVSGPVRTLPGATCSVVQLPTNPIMCDEHEDVVAVKRVQGETDSFGAEYSHMCQQCYDKYTEEVSAPKPGCCDWCKTMADDINPTRDPDEGSCGPVYYVCMGCKLKSLARRDDDDEDY